MDHTATVHPTNNNGGKPSNRFPSIRKKSFRRAFIPQMSSMDTKLCSAESMMSLSVLPTSRVNRPETLDLPELSNHRTCK